MSIAAWNIRGLNGRVTELKKFIKKHKLDLFGLIETNVRWLDLNNKSGIFGNSIRVISNNHETTKYTVDTIWLCYDTKL